MSIQHDVWETVVELYSRREFTEYKPISVDAVCEQVTGEDSYSNSVYNLVLGTLESMGQYGWLNKDGHNSWVAGPKLTFIVEVHNQDIPSEYSTTA